MPGLYLEAADVARDCGDKRSLPIAAYNLGEIALLEDDRETARLHFQETLELNREQSDVGGQAVALVGLSFVALGEGDTDEAAALLGSSLRIASTLGARELIFSGLLGSAEVIAKRDETVRAARLLAAADALREEMGYKPSPLKREQRARIASILDGDRSALRAAQSKGHALTLEEAVAYALEDRDCEPAGGAIATVDG